MTSTPGWPKLLREELVELARRIKACEGSEDEIDAWAEQFESAVLMPNASSLLFWPENYDFRRDGQKIGSYDPTPEEVVDTVLAYRSTILGDGGYGSDQDE